MSDLSRSEALKSGGVNVAIVDAIANEQLKEIFKIVSFPTILLFDSGSYYTYVHNTDKDGPFPPSVEWLEKWALGGYEKSEKKLVPKVPTLLERAVAASKEARHQIMSPLLQHRNQLFLQWFSVSFIGTCMVCLLSSVLWSNARSGSNSGLKTSALLLVGAGAFAFALWIVPPLFHSLVPESPSKLNANVKPAIRNALGAGAAAAAVIYAVAAALEDKPKQKEEVKSKDDKKKN